MVRLLAAEGDERAADAVGGRAVKWALQGVFDAAARHETEIEEARAFGADATGQQQQYASGFAGAEIGEAPGGGGGGGLGWKRRTHANHRGEGQRQFAGARFDGEVTRGGLERVECKSHAGVDAVLREAREERRRFVFDVLDDAGDAGIPGKERAAFGAGPAAFASGDRVAMRIETWIVELVGEAVDFLGREAVLGGMGEGVPAFGLETGFAGEARFDQAVRAHDEERDFASGGEKRPAVFVLAGRRGGKWRRGECACGDESGFTGTGEGEQDGFARGADKAGEVFIGGGVALVFALKQGAQDVFDGFAFGVAPCVHG